MTVVVEPLVTLHGAIAVPSVKGICQRGVLPSSKYTASTVWLGASSSAMANASLGIICPTAW